MGSLVSKIRPLVVLTVLLVVTPAPSRAELDRASRSRRASTPSTESRSATSAPMKNFAAPPTSRSIRRIPRNQIIADIDLAPRNSEGKVEFSADLFILKPKDSSHGNGVVFFDVVNRGSFGLLRAFSAAERGGDPTTEAHFGDASLLLQGYTLVAVGWQFNVPEDRIRLDAPIATDNGQPLRGWLREWFIPRELSDSYEWTAGNVTQAYPPVDLNAPDYRLTSREGLFHCTASDTARRLAVRPNRGWATRPRPELHHTEGGLPARPNLRAHVLIAESSRRGVRARGGSRHGIVDEVRPRQRLSGSACLRVW